MNPKLKIILSVLFVAAVTVLTAKVFIPMWQARETPKTIVRKKAAPSVKPKPKAAPASKTQAAHPRLAIILDDWGRNIPHVEDAAAIGEPLTLAVIPHLPHSREVAKRAHDLGLGVMLHMPMEPKSRRQPTEPHTIRVASTDDEIRRYLDEALADVAFAKGVNNHQGSAATSDARVMRTVMTHLKKKKLFFIDSQVIATSVGAKTADAVGIPFTKRDLFIDNDPSVEAVIQRLDEAAEYAHKHGRAVVIGHDKASTIEAIRLSAPSLKKEGIRFVLAQELLE